MESQNPPETNLALDALRRLVRALRASSHQIERRAGISGAQLFVLHHLGTPAPSLRELSGRTLTDPSSISVVVSRLEERGFIQRRRAAADARKNEISLTPSGRALARKAPEPIQVRLIDALGRMTVRDRKTLARLLDGLVQHMGLDGEAPGMFFEEASKPKTRRLHGRA